MVLKKKDFINVTGKNAPDCTHSGKITVSSTERESPNTPTGSAHNHTSYLEITVEALGHNVKQWTVKEEATCQKNEVRIGTCERCQIEVEEEAADTKVGHRFTNYKEIAPADCANGATLEAQCDFGCGTTDIKTGTTLDPKRHAWGSFVSDGNGTHTRICKNNSAHTETADCRGGTATCTKKAVCAECGGEYGQIDPENHTVRVIPAVQPTRERTGLTEGAECSECGKILIQQEVIPALQTIEALPKTGDSRSAGKAAMALMASVAGILLLKKRGRKA